ncbi:MAG: chorismate synthase [Elusimicrobia bacterium GWA2_69_24]|nr:MAG: chorismate synthase [Elusimicrobia bacterium GWA2_69_24]
MRLLTAGESHGPALCGILEGLPAGLPLAAADLDRDLDRRQQGHGRGGRMGIEKDAVEILGGLRHGVTLGSPLALLIRNRDNEDPREPLAPVSVPTPGHADLPGSVKYGRTDLRDILERASARETAIRVALAGAARRLLEEFGIRVASRVVAIGAETDDTDPGSVPLERWNELADASPVRCLGAQAAGRMTAAIDAAKRKGDTLGGVFETVVWGLPAGLGSHVQWDRRLDGILAQAFMSLNAVKGVEIGMGFAAACRKGSEVHDALHWDERHARPARRSNRSGGLDGGMTTGEPLVLRAAMKPIPGLAAPLPSVDLGARRDAPASAHRSDVCAVPAASVIAESLAALETADAFLLKYGGDSIAELRSHYEASNAL